MPTQMTDHLFSLLTPHLSPPSLALTAASSASLYYPSIQALYATLDLSRGVPPPSVFLSPDAPCAPHLPLVRSLKMPAVMRYNSQLWRDGLGRMKGLRKVVVGAEWDAWPSTGFKVAPLALGRAQAGARVGDVTGMRVLDVGRDAGRDENGRAEIFAIRASRSGRDTSAGGESKMIKRRLELEIVGARSPLSPLPRTVEKTDILENTESVTLRLELGLPVIKERQEMSSGSDQRDSAGPSDARSSEGGGEGEGKKQLVLPGVDTRRSILHTIKAHPNIQHLKILLPCKMYQKQPRALVDAPIHYRHLDPATAFASALRLEASRRKEEEQEQVSERGWQHIDLQHDLVHLARNIPARYRLDYVVPADCAREAWVGQLREAVREQLRGERVRGNIRWCVEGQQTWPGECAKL